MTKVYHRAVIDLGARPKLVRNCRLKASPSGETLLLMPEGALRLRGTAPEIITLCDGARTVAQVLEAMVARYPAVDRAEIQQELLNLLGSLRDKCVLEIIPDKNDSSD